MEAGNLTAALNLGALYYEGNFIERDFKKAIHLYELATESDDNETRVRAWCNLGYCYYYGRDISVYKREDGVFVVPITSLKP